MPRFFALGIAVGLVLCLCGATSSAGQLGNAAALFAGDTVDSANGFAIADLAPLDFYVSEPSTISAWNLWKGGSGTELQLLVWRPVGGSLYEVVASQYVTGLTAGFNSIASTTNAIVQSGDVLGFYLPQGKASVISMSYVTGTAVDPYVFRAAAPAIGEQVTIASSNADRKYRLNVDLVPIPEPTLMQMGALLGMSGIGLLRMRRK